VENPHKKNNHDKDKGKYKIQSKPTIEQIQETNPSSQKNENKKSEDGGDTIMKLEDQDLANIDLEKFEEAFKNKELQTISVKQLRKVDKVFIDSTTKATS
jgi:hypothetical protein